MYKPTYMKRYTYAMFMTSYNLYTRPRSQVSVSSTGKLRGLYNAPLILGTLNNRELVGYRLNIFVKIYLVNFWYIETYL